MILVMTVVAVNLSVAVTNCRQIPARDSLQRSTTPINPTPHAPGVRDFTVTEDQTAAELLSKVQDDARNVARRRLLATHYTGNSPRLRQFFNATADFLETGAASDSLSSAQQVTYRCPAEVGPETHEAYLDLQHRFAFAGPEDAGAFVDAATAALQRNGNSCDLLIMWARAVILLSEWKPSSLPATAQEKALRILFDVGEAYAPFHEGEPSPQLFLDVARYFAVARRDFVSAYVAAKWARQRLENATQIPDEMRQRYIERITLAEHTYRERIGH